MKWLYKRQRKIFLALALFITFSVVLGSLGVDFMSRSPLDAAIQVNDRKITRKRFNTMYQQALEQQRDNPQFKEEAAREFLKRQVVQMLVQEEVFLREADRYGVRVSNAELAQYIQGVPQFQKDGRFDPSAYGRFLDQIRMKPLDFEDEQRRQIRVQKTQYLMMSGVKISSLEWPRQLQNALAAAPPDEKKKILDNPQPTRDRVRNQEIQASLQEWYTAVNTQLKVKVLLDNDKPAAPPAAETPPVKQG